MYYLFYNFDSSPAAVSENTQLKTTDDIGEVNRVSEKDLQNSIRKIADINALTDKSMFPLKPQDRKPASQNSMLEN